jgi:hypothetical protein
MGVAGCQRRSRLTAWRARCPRGLWRIPRRALTSGVVAKTDRTGKAHRCLVHGALTTTASTIHRNPGLLYSARMTGKSAIALLATLANLRAPAPFQRFVDDDIEAASSLDKGLDDERE